MKKIGLLLTSAFISLSMMGCEAKRNSIGILQFGNFDALNKAREGFEKALKDNEFNDLKIETLNANAEGATNSTYAKTLASKRNKLNLAIATPSATALRAAQDSIGSTTPLLFTAVTDPVDAKLVVNPSEPEGFTTGSSDAQPAESLNEQIKLVKSILPDSKKLGIFYSSSETNSRVQAEKVEKIAKDLGIETVTKTCSGNDTIKNEALALINQVDAIWIPTDNMISNNVGKFKEALGNKKVLVIVGEEGMLETGHISISISYFDLGYETGKLAVDILNGKAIKDVPVFYPTIESCSYLYNKDNLDASGFSLEDLPQEFAWKNYK